MASSPLQPLDLDLTIVSAKQLKNVNWRQGELKPYAVFWVDPDSKLATKPDDSGSTRPVWNERFTVPIPLSLHASILTLEIFHSKPSETPKPIVGSLRYPLKDLLLLDSDDSNRIKTLELRRPSGRPHGKISLKISVRERCPDYHITPPSAYYYSSAPPPSPSRDYRGAFSPSPSLYGSPQQQSHYPYGGYADHPYSGYYQGYYSPPPPPPPPPRPFFDRGSGPSAPVDFSASAGNSLYDQKPKGGKMGMGAGLAVGAVAGAMGGLALEEGVKYEEEKITERDLVTRGDDYSDYRGDY